MRKQRRVLLAALLVVLAAGIAWFVPRPNEPVYQGKRLSLWLTDMEDWNGDTNSAAVVAFHSMGTNALPQLLQVLLSTPNPWQKIIAKINRKQSVIELPFGDLESRTMAATWALYALGTNAKPAFPVLTNLFLHTNALGHSSLLLAGLGSEGIPILLAALTNADYRIRFLVIGSLGWARSDFDTIVPVLIARMQDSSSLVRRRAANSLGQLHARPDLAVPALMKSFTSNDVFFRDSILVSLGLFESKARDAVPMIQAALKDNDPSVRKGARYALQQIDPEAAAKLGIK